MEIRDIEPVNPRLTERRTGFSNKMENQKKVSPSICYSCYSNSNLSSCNKCKIISCGDCLTKNMCESCYQNSRVIRNFFCCGSKKIYP
jgi:hypothetical protein